jgi:hypothetical protein
MSYRPPAPWKRTPARNWIAYHCEALVTSGVMPTWEAATYLTENLFGERPNPRLLDTANAHETTKNFFHYLYQPIVEAASREVNLPSSSTVHIFTDLSLTGNSAVLVVLFPGQNKGQQLLLLDAAKAWDLVFPNADSFNAWAEERYRVILQGLRVAVAAITHEEQLMPAV